jgi:hypothetical protein
VSPHPFDAPLASERLAVAAAYRTRPDSTVFPRAAARIAEGMCANVLCSSIVDGFTNSLSRREWMISGLCEGCQDKVFTTPSWVPPEPVTPEEDTNESKT